MRFWLTLVFSFYIIARFVHDGVLVVLKRRQIKILVPARLPEKLGDVERFVRDVKSDKLASGARVDLSYIDGQRVIGLKGIKQIADILSHLNFPVEVTIDLSNQNIGNNGARYLLKELQKDHYPLGLKIILTANRRITDRAIIKGIYQKLGTVDAIISENFASESDRDPSYVGSSEYASLLGKDASEIGGVELKPLFSN